MMSKARAFTASALIAAIALAATAAEPQDTAPASAPAAATKAAATVATGRYVKEGVVVEFAASPVDSAELMEGLFTDVRFRLTDEASGQPIRNANPAAWLDLGEAIGGRIGTETRDCRDKIALYLKGVVGIRPMIDLNNYYVLVLNKDPSITVVDPVVSMAGRTSTYADIVLRRPPQDIAKSTDDKRVFVSMPAAGLVGVIDTDKFRLLYNIEAGDRPTRLAVQPDGKYLWVGNNSHKAEHSGVTVIDIATSKRAAQIATGRGHHEIAFSDDSRTAVVTNREDGTLTVIDVQTFKKVQTIKTGSTPLSVAYSELSKAFYVTDGKDGTITVIDGAKHAPLKTITAKPGLGPLRFSWDGRWGATTNISEDKVYLIDASSNELVHELAAGVQPYQVIFTRAFAYVRALGSERVTMINLSSLGAGKQPIVQSFAAGSAPPKLAGDLPIADAMTPAKLDAAMFVVNPADNTTYFYMEGMNAPMGNYRTFGHQARGVLVIDRSLKELEPGTYSARVRLPAPGRYDVAFMLNTPRMLHCFAAEAKPNPLFAAQKHYTQVEFQVDQRLVKTGTGHSVRFKLSEMPSGKPLPGVKDVVVRYFMAPMSPPMFASAKELGDGVYEANLTLAKTGAYYVYVEARSVKLGTAEQAYLTLRAMDKPPASTTDKPAARGNG